MNKLKTYIKFVNENIKQHNEIEKLTNNDSFFSDIKKILDSLNLKYNIDEYNEIFNSESLILSDIKYENPYTLGSHPSNAGDVTNYSRKGSIGSSQLEKLSKEMRKLRMDRSKDYFDRNFGLYYDGTRSFYVYISK